MPRTLPLLATFIAMPFTLSAARAQDGGDLPVPGRSMVATRYGIVASSQPLASQAAVQVLHGAATRSMRPSRPMPPSA
ncbi:MAG: hypothetical protein P8177_11305 [Gemmatimonadota bacterium]